MRNILLLFPVLLWFSGQLSFSQSGPADPPGNKRQAGYDGFSFRSPGPTRGGRVTTVTGVREQPGSFYMGSTGGGVWKTEDNGISWTNVSDGYFATPSIGALRVAPGHPETVWAGTGSDGIRSNVILGRGVYRSDDGGQSWTYKGLEHAGQIGALEIHPSRPEVVFVAAIGNPFGPNPERGVYRTKDGGKNWEQVLYISDSTGAVDLEFCPGDPETLYASVWHVDRKPWTIVSGNREGGIYRSTDGGDSWEKLGGGLPSGIFGKSDLAVSPADPDRLYALVEAPAGEGGLYRSDDRGESFRLVSTQANLLDRPFYYCNLDADPTRADVLYVNTTGFFKSTDAGKSWKRMSTPHGDNHDMWINPDHPEIFIQSNDGGANITLDGGRSWSTQLNQPTAELYQVETDDQFPYWLYAGQQDNTTIALPSLPPWPAPAGPASYWLEVGGCETGPAVPKPGDANTVYSNCKGRFGVYDKRTGQEKQYYVGAVNMYGHNPADLPYRFQRVSPIHVSPYDPRVVYHASQYLHRTRDEGKTWETISPDLTAFEPDKQVISGSPVTRDITGEEFYSTIYSVRESPLEAGVIWTGANDGPVWLTRDQGAHWQEVTPPDLPPGGRVDAVEPSPHRKGSAYISVLRYQLNDWHPYVYRTDDYGASWTLLSPGNNGIPVDLPVRVVREDPWCEGLLFAGTESGLFLSRNNGTTWESFQLNLPVTPVTDIRIREGDLVLSTMGRGFWILDQVGFLRQEIPEDGPVLFRPGPAYRMRYGSRASSSVPEYKPAGMYIDFYLGQEAPEGIHVKVLDAGGSVVWSREPGTDNEKEETALPKGYHRVFWDLRAVSAGAEGMPGRRSRGPLVVPGEYTLQLSCGDEVLSTKAEIRADPRVLENGVSLQDMQEQYDLSLRIAGLYLQADQLSRQVKQKRKDLDLRRSRDRKTDQALEKLDQELNTAEGPYMTPMLLDQIGYLYSMLDMADQKPGRDAYERLEELESWLNRLEREWDKIIHP